MKLTEQSLIEYAAFVIALTEDSGLPLSEALYEAAREYPICLAITDDMEACKLLGDF
jgi:siroheme synthase (precorrin-2 oxidase/ferrochelatase)